MFILIIVLVSIAVYFRSLFHHYVSDDLMVYSYHSGDKPNSLWRIIVKSFMGQGYWDFPGRKVEDNKYKGEARNYIAHGLTIGLHTVASVLVYTAFGSTNQSFIAALLFCLSPVNHEGSLWLSGKPYVWTACFVLLGYTFPVIAPLVYLTTTWSAHAVTIITASIPYVLTPQWYFAPLCLYCLWRKMEHFGKSDKAQLYSQDSTPRRFNPGKIVIATKFYGYNLVNSIMCIHATQFQSYMADVFTSASGARKAYKIDVYLIAGIAGFMLTGIGVWIGSAWGKGLFWYTVCIFPFINLVSIGQQLVTSRYAYLAHAGLYYSLSIVLWPYPYALGAIVGWYASRLQPVIFSYKNDYWNTQYLTFDEPYYSQSWIYHGAMHFSRNQFNAAFADFVEAKNQDKACFKAWFNMSSCCVALGRIPEAIEYLEEAKKCDLLFQQQTRDNFIHEREALIGSIYLAKKQGKEIRLRIEDIALCV